MVLKGRPRKYCKSCGLSKIFSAFEVAEHRGVADICDHCYSSPSKEEMRPCPMCKVPHLSARREFCPTCKASPSYQYAMEPLGREHAKLSTR